jgi:hypothetical protein
MSTRILLAIFAIIMLAISLPFVCLHLLAAPDDAPITALQHGVAALANYFGPWGVVIVRLVDFPNAGLRSFSWTLAIGLTLLGALLVVFSIKISKRPWQILLSVCWSVFVAVWFGVGFVQIADGLL